MELKHTIVYLIRDSLYTFNRTFMELKLEIRKKKRFFSCAFNRTFMELKPIGNNIE